MASENRYSILCVCTSVGMSSWGAETGLWLPELSTPYFLLTKAGYEVDICTIKGGPSPLDPFCLSEDNRDEHLEDFMSMEESQRKFTSAKSLAEVTASGDLSKYACIYLCGGHGCVDDFYKNSDITEAVEKVYIENSACVASICHGALGLVDAKVSGKSILCGKICSVFSNEEEQMLGLTSKLPVLTEEACEEVGAVTMPGQPW